VADVIDKGEGRGALVIWQKELYDKASGDHLATVETVAFCRGDGGFGGPSRALSQPQPHPIPDRAPDLECVLPTSPQAALIYRLSGDWNPLHAEPAVARAAGFERPILHGLATFGVAGHALLRGLGNYNAGTLRSMRARFTTPVYPGETLSTEIWREEGHVSFRVKSVERGVVAINNGYATLI
jgi:acyl dehydratase